MVYFCYQAETFGISRASTLGDHQRTGRCTSDNGTKSVVCADVGSWLRRIENIRTPSSGNGTFACTLSVSESRISTFSLIWEAQISHMWFVQNEVPENFTSEVIQFLGLIFKYFSVSVYLTLILLVFDDKDLQLNLRPERSMLTKRRVFELHEQDY